MSKKYVAANREKARANNRASYAKHTETRRRRYLKRVYGLSIEDCEQILKEQEGRCGICRELIVPTASCIHGHIDHDHSKKIGDPGFIRGILCAPCNMAGGMFRENPEHMRRAISWFSNFKAPKISVDGLALEEWNSNQNHTERHFFIPANEFGYQSSLYVFGYNPAVINQDKLKRILAVLEDE